MVEIEEDHGNEECEVRSGKPIQNQSHTTGFVQHETERGRRDLNINWRFFRTCGKLASACYRLYVQHKQHFYSSRLVKVATQLIKRDSQHHNRSAYTVSCSAKLISTRKSLICPSSLHYGHMKIQIRSSAYHKIQGTYGAMQLSRA
jgi:hypothetical protein